MRNTSEELRTVAIAIASVAAIGAIAWVAINIYAIIDGAIDLFAVAAFGRWLYNRLS